MIKEYRTIREINGPLMMIRNVEGVTYDELAQLELPDGIDAFTEKLWASLNADNKVSLFVRYLKLSDGTAATRIVNRHEA